MRAKCSPWRLSLFCVLLVALCCLWCTADGATVALRGATDDTVSPSSSLPQSQCAACRDWATCDYAFRGRRGKFCSNDQSGAACCCPVGAWCEYDYWEGKCRCKAMAFGEHTPVVIGATVLMYVVATIFRCIHPPRSSSTQSVADHSRLFSTYGSTFAGDTGGGSTFSGDTGGGGGTFSGDS